MGLISNGTTLLDAGAIDSGVATGSLIHIKTLTASSSGTLSFVHGSANVVLDGTYKEYIFKYINIHPASVAQLTFNLSIDSGSNYNITKTTTAHNSYMNENGSSPGMVYRTAWDLAQSTNFQIMAQELGNGADESGCGYLHLYDPANTSKVKQFMGTTTYHQTFGANGSFQVYYGGYGNTTSAVNAVQFKMSSGNIDSGLIKLYGVKPS
jgi:hypothetical protein